MENTIGKQFMKMTKYVNLELSAQSQGVPQPALELEAPNTAELIELPSPASLEMPHIDLRLAVEQRETRRDYADHPLTLQEFTYLLWCTQGVKSVSDISITRRTVPSAGSRHAFETWLLINRVEGLQPGLYRYLALSHKMIKIPTEVDIRQRLTDACKHQKHVFESAVTLFWVAVTERMVWRYSQRGYRYMFLDAGHVCQNLYLAAEQIGCGVCAIAAYDDDLVNQALQLDGEKLFAIYIATLGKRNT